ncbi:MAG TPA: polysaccharide deacetylase family protein [Planktothrix sp.]|jgi:peptidoglycan/xylan/chitin deacetylase (PgdA/CDA1 family)
MSDAEYHDIDATDIFVLTKMELLKFLCKRILPHGHWGAPKAAPGETPHLVLTFDDGPFPETTLPLLELLDEEQVKATFFVMGRRVQKHQELLQKIAERGHQIGNHSFSHQFMPAMSTKKIEYEIESTNQLIKDATGSTPLIFRPPFGLIDHRAARMLQERSMKMVYWGAVSEDWLGIGEPRVVRRTLRRLQHGSMIVLHEGRTIANQTLGATRKIIQQAKLQGYTFDKIAVQ